MKELQELEAFCQERGLWLTYCTYQGKWKCYVNPGTVMTAAPWYKDRDEAIRAAKEAAGFYKTAEGFIGETVKIPFTVEALDNIAEKMDEKIMECTTAPVKKRGRPKGSKNKPKVAQDEQI